MSTPSRRDVHVNKLLSNVSNAYRNETYIADGIMPVVRVNKATDEVAVYNKGDWFRDNAAVWAPGSKKPMGDYRLGTPVPYYCEPWSMSKMVTDAVVDNSDDVYRPAREAAEWSTDQVLLSRERRVASLLFSTTTFASYYAACISLTGGGAVQWNTTETSTPIRDILKMRENVRGQIGRYPNTIVMGAGVWAALNDHPDFLDRVKYSQLGILTTQLFSSIVQIPRVFIGTAVYASAQEGASTEDTLSDIWSDYVLTAWVPPAPGLLQPALGYIIQQGDRQVQEYRYEEEEATKYSVTEWVDELVIAAMAGYMISDVLA